LSDCSITEEGYTALAEALKSSHLIELDLRGNDPGDSGVKLLTDLLHDPDCTLNTLSLLKSADAEEACKCLTNIVGKNPLLHKELDLSTRTPEDIKVNQLSALLQDPHYRLQKLTLYYSVSVKSCTDVVSALCTNPSHIRELDLSWCKLGDSGVEKLCDLLKKHECKLETLRLEYCSITDRHCAALTAALKLNSSHLKHLNLRENKLGNSVTELEELLQRSGGRLVYTDMKRNNREKAECT
ncbi:protein NLRC5-like, partial [Clarias magur]